MANASARPTVVSKTLLNEAHLQFKRSKSISLPVQGKYIVIEADFDIYVNVAYEMHVILDTVF